MKKLLIISLINLAMLNYCYSQGVNQEVTSNENTSNAIIIGPDNTDFSISLDSNPSTGFRWFLYNYNNQLITPVSNKYTPNQSPEETNNITGMVGGGGTDLWKFQANQDALTVPQVTDIVFIYARSWEFNQANQADTNLNTKTIKVVLDPNFKLKINLQKN